MLAFGSAHLHLNVITGLREVGEYKKPIYVITDHKNVSDISHYGATPVYVDQNQPVFETEEARFAWENSKLTKVKLYKTQIFNIVPEKANIKTILFLDAVSHDNLLFSFVVTKADCI